VTQIDLRIIRNPIFVSDSLLANLFAFMLLIALWVPLIIILFWWSRWCDWWKKILGKWLFNYFFSII